MARQSRAAATRPVRGTPPTHVAFGGRAYAIGRDPLVLGLAPQGSRPLSLTGPAAGESTSAVLDAVTAHSLDPYAAADRLLAALADGAGTGPGKKP